MTPVIIIIFGAMLINFAFCPNKMYMIKFNLWFGNISITIITVHVIIKKGNLFIYYIHENNSFSFAQLTQIMDINHFKNYNILFIHKDRRRGACDC